MSLALLLLLAGSPVQFCVGDRIGAISTCADTFSELPSEVDGRLYALDAVGNSSDWGPFCSWHGVRVLVAGGELGVLARDEAARRSNELDPLVCDEVKRRLAEAADVLTRAELVRRDEWPGVRASALRAVVISPARVLAVPRGEELVEGVYVPSTKVIHLTATLEAAPHELFHAVLASRGGASGHSEFSPLVNFIQGAFAAKRRGPVL